MYIHTSFPSASLKVTEGGSGFELISILTAIFGLDLENRGALSLLTSSFVDVDLLSKANMFCAKVERIHSVEQEGESYRLVT